MFLTEFFLNNDPNAAPIGLPNLFGLLSLLAVIGLFILVGVFFLID